jgi:hypothetical protein
MRVPRPSKCFLAVPEVFRFSFVTAEIFNLKIDFFFHSRTLQGPLATVRQCAWKPAWKLVVWRRWGQRKASRAMPDDGVVASATHPHPSAGDARKLSVEQQKQLLGSIYAAFWTFKIIAAGVVICILGLHGACCLFPNYKTSDAVRCSAMPRGCAPCASVRAQCAARRDQHRSCLKLALCPPTPSRLVPIAPLVSALSPPCVAVRVTLRARTCASASGNPLPPPCAVPVCRTGCKRF